MDVVDSIVVVSSALVVVASCLDVARVVVCCEGDADVMPLEDASCVADVEVVASGVVVC